MKSNVRMVTVAGQEFEVYSDYIARGTFATANGTTKQISFSGYVSNDLTTRKAIACAFGLATFRRNAK